MTALARPPHSPWMQLQTELRELAFALDRQGNPVAADLASNIAARIDEMLEDAPRDSHPTAPERLSA